MAENKKSFILYADLRGNIEHLTNEEKGILFNHLLEYVNDMDPILEDRLILTAWKPIERQLKRDLQKFEEVKVKRSDAGKRSAQIRALNKSEQSSTKSTSVESVKHRSTNPTVNDNDNENVNDNDNVNDIKELVVRSELKIRTKILDRKHCFKLKVLENKEKYTIDMLKDFFEYWSEHGENDRKMRFEKQKSFGLSRRLSTWKSNQRVDNNPNNLTAKEKMKIKIGSVSLEDVLKSKQ
tara:strand:- start:1220 stop:1933 length:714 start_codon:yes stop_codon:yes gene_type:complete